MATWSFLTNHSWDRIGPVLEPSSGETTLSDPCVIDVARTFTMIFCRGDGEDSTIEMATSRDGVSWKRRGATLVPSDAGPDAVAVKGPCAVRLPDGTRRMWYAAARDHDLSYRICSARFPTRWPL